MRASFRHLWLGQTLSAVGDSVSSLAIPLTAVALDASTLSIGLLSATSIAGYLIIGLPAGAMLDRTRKRPVLISLDLARAVNLTAIPASYLVGHLTLGLLFVVALIHSLCSAVFSIGYQAYVPRVVERDALIAANSRLQGTQFVAQVAGPNLAGLLVQIFTAPISIVADTVSFLASAWCVATIKERELPPEPRRISMSRSIVEGFEFLVRQPVLRALVAYSATANLASSAAVALSAVFLARTVGLSALWIGLVLSSATAGGIVGSILAARVRAALGPVRVFWVPLAIAAIARLMVPLTTTGAGVLYYVGGAFIPIAAATIFNINSAAYRQAITPAATLSRVTSCVQFATWGVLPLGAALGGLLGEYLPMRTAMAVIVTGHGLAALWFANHRLRDALGGGTDGQEPASVASP